MLKTGIKMQFGLFTGEKTESVTKILDAYGGIERFLNALKGKIYAVEIATVSHSTNPQELRKAVELCKSYGLFVTIHGKLCPDISAEEFFAPYSDLELKGDSLLNITLHPLKTAEETESQLKSIVSYIEELRYNVCINLENQRNKNEDTAYAGCMGVKEIVKKINNPHLKICFDFGHQLSNILKEKRPNDLFDDEFLSLVGHTHIHSYFEGSTHFPLSVGETAFDKNLSGLLKHNYQGVYLLELMPERYMEKFPIKSSYDDSISIINTAVMQAEKKLEGIKEYEKMSECISLGEKLLKDNACGMLLLGPSGYVVSLGTSKIAVDPSLSLFPYKEKDKEEIIRVLNQCDAIIVTHRHGDHFDEKILDQVDNSVKIYIPDFLDYERENTISVTKGESILINDVSVTFFESAHSLGENQVPEYGFALEYKDKNYVFPVDVRDYKRETKTFPNTQVLVSHLWLGRKNALKLYNNECTDDFCKFVNGFGAKKVYMAHVYDVHRDIQDMWTEVHFNLVKDKINNSQMIRMGEYVRF